MRRGAKVHANKSRQTKVINEFGFVSSAFVLSFSTSVE